MNNFQIIIDGHHVTDLNEWLETNTAEDVDTPHPDDIEMVRNLQPGEKCHVGLMSVERSSKELTSYEVWQIEKYGNSLPDTGESREDDVQDEIYQEEAI